MENPDYYSSCSRAASGSSAIPLGAKEGKTGAGLPNQSPETGCSPARSFGRALCKCTVSGLVGHCTASKPIRPPLYAPQSTQKCKSPRVHTLCPNLETCLRQVWLLDPTPEVAKQCTHLNCRFGSWRKTCRVLLEKPASGGALDSIGALSKVSDSNISICLSIHLVIYFAFWIARSLS